MYLRKISSLIKLSCVADLKNTDLNSEVFMKKLHRAHEALSQSDGSATSSVKTLSASFGTKWPYKRTMSAPASMIPRQDTKQGIYIYKRSCALILKFFLLPFRALHRLCRTLCVIFFFCFPHLSCRKGKGVQPTVFRAHLEKEELEIWTGSVVGVYPA